MYSKKEYLFTEEELCRFVDDVIDNTIAGYECGYRKGFIVTFGAGLLLLGVGHFLWKHRRHES